MRVYLEDHPLSDGGRAKIWKLGRKYIFLRTFPQDQCPVDFSGTKAEAYRKLEACLKADVCDTGYIE
jgi:hypothetical protein